MKKILINVLLIIIVTALSVSCCPLSLETLGNLIRPNGGSDVDEASDIVEVDQGTFSGVPQNIKISSVLISGQAIDVDISGNYAYVTNDLGVLYIINISDKERPYITGKCKDIDSANIVIVEGEIAYVSYTEWITGEEDYYTECGFKIIDISDKEDPVVIGEYSSGNQDKKTVFGLYIDGDNAYLNTSNYKNGSEINTLEIIDITKKSSPELISELILEGSPANITVNGDIAFININYYDYDADKYYDTSKMLMIDISDREMPVVTGSVEVPANSWGIYHKDGMVYLSSHFSDDEQYSESMVQVVDISTGTPVLRGNISIPGGAWELDMTGRFLYVSDLKGGVFTIDIDDPDEPFIAGRLNTGGTSYDITLKGNYGYIADGFNGLVIMELSDEDSPETYESVKPDHKNLPPQAVLDIFGDTAGEYYIAGTPIIFSGVNSYDPESEEIDFRWNISGEETVDEQIVDKIFDEPGNYEVTLEVSDGDLKDSTVQNIYIADVNEPIYDIKSHDFIVEIEYILDNQSNESLKDIECLMRVPLDYAPYQYIGSINTSIPIDDKLYDNHRNKLIKFKIEDDLKPGELMSVQASFNVTVNEFDYANISQEMHYSEDDPDLFYYTRDDLFIDSDSPGIMETTKDLIGRETRPLKIAEILYKYITRNLYYDYERAEDRDYEFMSASEILETGSGVCADYSILYTAMLRAAGIPARLAAGIPVYTILYEPDKELDIGHAWVEVKIPGYGWIPIDITTEETFWTSNYFLDIATERGPGYIYEHSTMDWSSYYYDGYDYTWSGEGPIPEQRFIFRVKDLDLSEIIKD